VTYLSAADLKELLALTIMPDGMVQRFVAPVGRNNVHLVATCGPRRQLSLERFQSLVQISDRVMVGCWVREFWVLGSGFWVLGSGF
jgi:hypothetical protein